MTEPDQTALRLTELYAQRITIEELFREDRSRRNGFTLRGTQVSKAERLDLLLLVVALGLQARGQYRLGQWCSNQRPRECSDFTIGQGMLDHLPLRPSRRWQRWQKPANGRSQTGDDSALSEPFASTLLRRAFGISAGEEKWGFYLGFLPEAPSLGRKESRASRGDPTHTVLLGTNVEWFWGVLTSLNIWIDGSLHLWYEPGC